jgi:hypothetical protein
MSDSGWKILIFADRGGYSYIGEEYYRKQADASATTGWSDMWKKVLLGCGVVFVLVIVGLVVAGYFISRSMSGRMHMPVAFSKPGALVGKGLLSSSPFPVIGPAGVGQISDMIVSGSNGPIAIAGDEGAAEIRLTGIPTPSAMVDFGKPLGRVSIVTSPSGTRYYLNRGSWGEDAQLMDLSGKTLWTYGGLQGVDDAAGGDINGDGKLEFVVGFNGAGGVHLIDWQGRKMWRQGDGNVWHVEMVDVNGDGKLEIVHSNAGGMMTIRSATGSVIRQSKPATYFSHFSLCHWPTITSKQYALQAADGYLYILDFNGGTVAKLNAPNCGFLGEAHGVPIRFQSGGTEMFAVLVVFDNWHASVLYVYGVGQKLVYEEVLPGVFTSAAVVPSGAAKGDLLLLGGKNEVMRCSWASP